MDEKEVLFFYSLYKPEDGTLEGTRRRFLSNPPKIDALHIELHSQLAFLFKKFKELCDNNNINYFLMGGSCIGAIRQGGIIPWDTDGDVGMSRADYLKFRKVVKNSNYLELLEAPVIVLAGRTRTGYLKKKVAIKGTSYTAIIDVIVWDRVQIDNDDNLLQFWRLGERYKESKELPAEDKLAEHVENLSKEFLEKYGSETGNYMMWGLDNFKSIRAANPVRILPYDTFFPLKTIKFLGDDYKICNNVDNYIKQEWGDIWTVNMGNKVITEGENYTNKMELLSNDREIINAMQ